MLYDVLFIEGKLCFKLIYFIIGIAECTKSKEEVTLDASISITDEHLLSGWQTICGNITENEENVEKMQCDIKDISGKVT